MNSRASKFQDFGPREEALAISVKPVSTDRVSSITIGRAEPVRPGLLIAEQQVAKPSRLEDLTLFLLVAILGSAIGIWAMVGLHFYDVRNTDNLARTYLAVQVFFGYEPKLANIGFVWPPVPSLLQLPLVLLFPALAFQGATGPIVSALSGGVCLVILNRILSLYVPKRALRYTLLGLYQLNPLVLYLTISGLSEIVFLMFVLLAWLALQRLYFEEPIPIVQVGVLGIAAAGALLSRYEGIIYGMLIGGLLTVMFYLHKHPGQWPLAEGFAITYVTPFGYALGLWVFFNAIIVGDPLYFMTGKGSNREFMAAWLEAHPVLDTLVGNIPAATSYAMRAAWDVSPSFY